MKRKQKFAWVTKIDKGTRLISLIVKRLILACWSMILFILILPYQIFRVFVPVGRPGSQESHPISKFFRKTIETKKTRQIAGAGLTVIMIFSGLLGKMALANESLTTDQTIISQPVSQVMTITSLDEPIRGVRAQGFHTFHPGLDILAPVGTEIMPVNEGKVVEASYGRIGWGNTVVVEHPKGLRTRYAHMREIQVEVGQVVNKGVALGTVGMTGWTTGPHLHLEMYQNNRAIDPETVLPEDLL